MKKLISLLILIVFFGGTFLFWGEIVDTADFFKELFWGLPEVEKETTSLVEEVEKQILAPEPLRALQEAPVSLLTQAGVIQWTNVQREERGLAPLRESKDLNAAALLKAKDILAGQYFEHISPSGEGVKDLVELVGYEFIAIGENLALGNFKDDQALVQGWMDSPGHRANILNQQYQEIGVAVLQIEFEGRSTWLAVQHFGLPLSACPRPSEDLEAEIIENREQLESLQAALSGLKEEIESMKPKRGEAYSQKVEEYNQMVNRYNALLSVTQDLIDQYNLQVLSYNECADIP